MKDKDSMMKQGSCFKKIVERSKAWIFSKSGLVTFLLMMYDICVLVGSYFVALWLRFDCRYSLIPVEYYYAWLKFSPIYVLCGIAVFWLLRLYSSLWRFASFVELRRIVVSSALLFAFHTVMITVLFSRMPISYYIFGGIIQFVMTVLSRFFFRFLLLLRGRMIHSKKDMACKVMLVGAGAAGQMILRDINNSRTVNDYVCCIIDDDKDKWGRSIDSIPIVGGRNDIFLNVEKYNIDKIYVAIPSMDPKELRNLLDVCKETGCLLKNLPGIGQLVTGEVTSDMMEIINVEDLLGRDPIKVNSDEISEFIKGKVILVTGGGGSIGSELCRQIAKNSPKKLIIFDIYENNAYDIGCELHDNFKDLDYECLIGSVRDSRRLNQIFRKYKPQVVYHAAAHKHLPLMEDSPCECIKNNAVGTYKTAYAAMMNGVERFVLISTDKAVNPTNIMGASKRLCEMVIQSFDRKVREGKVSDIRPLHMHYDDDDDVSYAAKNDIIPKTEFVAVRFGNVLNSNGSVIPRFQKQIKNGGPVTVTHPDIIRYFMTIPEAVSLVLQAGTYANGGEIFVLDMGEPVKIDTLARNLIKLSGLVPDVDIKISYTGLRHGEKMFEEKLMDEEGLRTTDNKLIHIGSPIPFDTDEFLNDLRRLMTVAYDGDEKEVLRLTEEIVKTFKPFVCNNEGSESLVLK